MFKQRTSMQSFINSGQLVKEEMSFKAIDDARTDDGHQAHKSSHWAVSNMCSMRTMGSGELITIKNCGKEHKSSQ